MGKVLWVLGILIIIGLLGWAGFSYFFKKDEKVPEQPLQQTKTSNMKLTSLVFENNQMIPEKYTCDGQDINPPLIISETPEDAQSLVLIVDDPDAPMGTWTHWIVYNINPQTTSIEENSLPEGAVQLKNDFGKENYGGPCPPSGTHRYFFKIFALDKKLDLPLSSKLETLEQEMNGHILDESKLVGLYQKK